MSLILRLGSAAVNWPTRGIFEQSALKIRANDCKLIVLAIERRRSIGRLASKLIFAIDASNQHVAKAAQSIQIRP
jgi:hypothetical protein